MAGRRLTISSLLCADDQLPERSQPQPPSTPSSTSSSYPPILSGPGVPPPNELKELQDKGFLDSHWESSRRAYTELSQDSQDTVPLSLQAVHLRRHTPSPSPIADGARWIGNREDTYGPPEMQASSSRVPHSPQSRDRDSAFSSYPSSYNYPQSAPRSIPSPRRSSELDYQQSDGALYYSPPHRARSRPLATPPYVPPLSHPFSHSPLQSSPAFHIPPSGPLSQSPPLSLRPVLTSPTNTYRLMSHSPSYGNPQPPFPAPVPTQLQSPPSLVPSASSNRDSNRASHYRSTSFSQPEIPSAVGRSSSSAAALNNLLNAEPARPHSTRGNSVGLGGLEALVQAATAERRRLSGEHPTPLEARESARKASLSPMLNRLPSPLPHLSHSPVLPKAPMASSPRDTRVNSLAVISLGHDGEPPIKRRRRTGSFGSGASAPRPGVAPIAPQPKEFPLVTPLVSTPVVPPPPRPVTPVRPAPSSLSAKPRSIAQLLSPDPPPKAPSLCTNVPVLLQLQSPRASPTQILLRPFSPISRSNPVQSTAVGTSDITHNTTLNESDPEIPTEDLATKVDADISPVAPTAELTKPKTLKEEVSEPRHDGSISVLDVSAKSPARLPPPIESHSSFKAVELAVSDIPDEDSWIRSPAIAQQEPIDGVEVSAHDTASIAAPSARADTVTTVSSAQLSVEDLSLSTIALSTTTDLPKHNVAVGDQSHLVSVGMEEVEQSVHCLVEPLQPHEVTTNFDPLSTNEVILAFSEEPPEPNSQVASPKSCHSQLMGEQDPYDWVSEPRVIESFVQHPRGSFPAVEEPPQTPSETLASPRPRDMSQVASPRPLMREEPMQHTFESKAVLSPPRSPTPTPTALPTREVDNDVSGYLSVSIPPRSEVDIDIGLELELAASVSPDTNIDAGMSTNDLDDELLSLVDDKPRQLHSPTHGHQYHAAASIPAPGATHGERHPKEELVKPVMPNVPAPLINPNKPSNRAVMPPPLVPPHSIMPATPLLLDKTQKPHEEFVAFMGAKKTDSLVKHVPKGKNTSVNPKGRPVPKPKVKPIKEKEGTAGSSGRLTPSGSSTATKGKKATAASASATTTTKRALSAATGPSRSRSTSEMPTPAEVTPKPKAQPEEDEESEKDSSDDKLYCICKTNYDEDKVMIACDRCDEWYHTQCLNMNDLEVDLIDQFVCPICIKANPNMSLQTTYKPRCVAGVKHPRPSSPSACHKPARGNFSKFCSDECGITYMERRIKSWGGDTALLWASIQDTKQREGVAVKVQVIGGPDCPQEAHSVQKPVRTQQDRTIADLQAQLSRVTPKRERLKKELEMILWRQRLLRLAAARADNMDECGWDQRLIFDEEEYAEFAHGVFESYEESLDDTGQVGIAEDHGELWWCRGKKKCQRHAGWQKLRTSEIDCDLEMNKKLMSQLTTKEREIRTQLEDVISAPVSKMVMPGSLCPPNGHNEVKVVGKKAKQNGTSMRKGKQKH